VLRTPFCDLVGIEHPIVQAAIWPATSPELVAAVSNAGGLGSLGAVFEKRRAWSGRSHGYVS
jgi:NAD(P)H-dependent flavin oxidoreductase YrpB (nitropropane dioxygenase family)